MSDIDEPGWLERLRPAAKRRPRTQFTKVRWHARRDLRRTRGASWLTPTEVGWASRS